MSDKSQNPKATQFLDLATVIANETCRYLENSGMTTGRLQKIINRNTEIRKIARKNAHDILQLVPNQIIQTRELLEKYFLEVFNLKINLSKVVFPVKDGFSTYMAVPPRAKLNEDKIMGAFVKKWGTNIFIYLEPVAENIDRSKEQDRPKGLYVFAHRGGDEPDQEYLGESYDDAMNTGYPFANAREYLLITGFHKFTQQKFMDKKGWTRTSSSWTDGRLVDGRWGETNSRLYLDRGFRDSRVPFDGPRELFLG